MDFEKLFWRLLRTPARGVWQGRQIFPVKKRKNRQYSGLQFTKSRRRQKTVRESNVENCVDYVEYTGAFAGKTGGFSTLSTMFSTGGKLFVELRRV